jgi:hypothetical protein
MKIFSYIAFCKLFSLGTVALPDGWVWVRVQGSKIFQNIESWVQVWVGFCKKHQNTSDSLSKFFFSYILRIFKLFFVEINLKIWNFLQKFKQNISKNLNSGSGTGSGFENFPKNRVLGSGWKPGTGSFSSLIWRRNIL